MNTQEPCKCPSCSGILVFDIREFALRCPGCGAAYDIEKYEQDHPMKQRSSRGTPNPEDWRCGNCGAVVYPGALALTGTCPCCQGFVRGGSSRRGDGAAPDLVIPFLYGRENLLKAFRESCADDPAMEDGFLQKITPESVRPVYLPCLIYDLKAAADITTGTGDTKGKNKLSWHFDLDLDNRPELLHDIPFQDASGKEPRGMSLLDFWKLDRAQPFRRAWFCGIRDKYGTAAPPDVLDPRKTPDFNSIKDRILNMSIRRLAQNPKKPPRILSQNIAIASGSIRYVLCPAWLLSVAYRGKTYLSVMNASNGNTAIPVPRSLLKRLVTASGLASFWTGIFALAHIPVTAPDPAARHDFLTSPPVILVLYLFLAGLLIALELKSYKFCRRHLFKGTVSVFLTSLAGILAGLLMIYAFFAVCNNPDTIMRGAAEIFIAFDVLLIPFCLLKR